MIKLNKTHLALTACSLLLLVFFIAPLSYLVGYYVAVNHYSEQDDFVYYYPEVDYKLDRNNPDEADVIESREYQVKLNVTAYYANRTAGVNELLNFIRNYTGLKLKDKDFKVDIYEEIQYTPEDCGRFYDELRKRKYYGDSHPNPKENATAVSINIDSSPHHYKKSVLANNLHPALQYKNSSEEKIEQDIHHDFRKFNRETKIKDLPDFTMTKCSDAMNLFPWAFPNTTDPTLPLSIRTGRSIKYIWEYAISDEIYYGTTKIKFAWTMYYNNVNDCYNPLAAAIDGYSEFSFRIYSLGEGYASWNKDVLTYIAKMYLAILDFYSVPYE